MRQRDRYDSLNEFLAGVLGCRLCLKITFKGAVTSDSQIFTDFDEARCGDKNKSSQDDTEQKEKAQSRKQKLFIINHFFKFVFKIQV